MEYDVGVLPEDFTVGFTYMENLDAFKLELVTPGSSNILLCETAATSIYALAGKLTNNRLLCTAACWAPYKLIFKRSTATLDIYSLGLYVKSISLGTLFDGVSRTANAKLVLTATMNGGTVATPLSQYLYMDNFYVNQYDIALKRNYTYDFEDQVPTAPLVSSSAFVNTQVTRGNTDINSTVVPYNFTLTNYDYMIANDPFDLAHPNNKVITGKRGNGSNNASFQGTYNVVVPKPTSDFTVEYRIANSVVNTGVILYAVDGTRQMMPINGANLNITTVGTYPAAVGQIISGIDALNKLIGGTSENIKATAIPANTWYKLKVVYNLATGIDSYYIDDVFIKNGTKSTANNLKTILTGSTETTMTLAFVPSAVLVGSNYYLDDIKVKVDQNVPRFDTLTYDESVAGTTTVGTAVSTGTWLASGAIVVSAVYKSNGDLADVKVSPVTTSSNIANLSLDTSKAGANYYIKTMLLDSLGNIKPFIAADTHNAPVQ